MKPTPQETKAFWSALAQLTELATEIPENDDERARLNQARTSARQSLDALAK